MKHLVLIFHYKNKDRVFLQTHLEKGSSNPIHGNERIINICLTHIIKHVCKRSSDYHVMGWKRFLKTYLEKNIVPKTHMAQLFFMPRNRTVLSNGTD